MAARRDEHAGGAQNLGAKEPRLYPDRAADRHDEDRRAALEVQRERIRAAKRADDGTRKCAGCGFTIAASATYCGECLCEDDSE